MAVAGDVPMAPFWAGLCALAFVSGTLSFAIVPAIQSGMGLAGIALLALSINFRYAFYGVSMVESWRGMPFFRKWFLIHSLADEIYALDVSCRLPNVHDRRFYSLCNHAFNFFYWVAGTTAGGIAGASLKLPSKGIEFAMTALFTVIFTDQIKYLCRKN